YACLSSYVAARYSRSSPTRRSSDLPQFWFGLNLIAIFSVGLRWFPVGGYVPLSAGLWESTRSIVLPAVTLGLIQAGYLARITRSDRKSTRLNSRHVKISYAVFCLKK